MEFRLKPFNSILDIRKQVRDSDWSNVSKVIIDSFQLSKLFTLMTRFQTLDSFFEGKNVIIKI